MVDGFPPRSDHLRRANINHKTDALRMLKLDLSMEQRFRLETAKRKVDDCRDVEALQDLSKALLTALEKQRAATRELMAEIRHKQ